MAGNINKKLSKERIRNFLGKDYTSFRGNVQDYVNLYYSDKMSDFSESGLAGLFLDIGAYACDTMSYYLDFQFNELDSDTAVDPKNLQKHFKKDGIKFRGATPSIVEIDITLTIPAVLNSSNEYVPNEDYLPVIRSGATATSNSGILFELREDCDFNKKNDNGIFLYASEINHNDVSTAGIPGSFLVTRTATFTSGQTKSESIILGPSFVPFRSISLGGSDINEIVSIVDTDNNEYYEVDNLSQDTVFKTRLNTSYDAREVIDILEIVPASRRFVVDRDISSGVTSVVFGSGNESEFQNNLVPDPKEISLNLYGRRTFTNFALDSNNLLKTDTLGISPSNTTLTITYRSGGGLSHNVAKNTISSITTFSLDFKSNIPVTTRTSIRSSIAVINPDASFGGENQLSIDEMRFIAINSRSLQSRIVTKEDIISRVYTMPSNLGRVFRIAAINNPDNPFSASLYVICRNSDGKLVNSTDTLKKNLQIYLNKFRLISDSIDILDSPAVNIGINYTVTVDSTYNKSSVIRAINSKLSRFLTVDEFQIGTPIVKADLQKIITSIQGVISVPNISIINKSGTIFNSVYSDFVYPINTNDINGVVYPPLGGMFELKYPEFDIIGRAH